MEISFRGGRASAGAIPATRVASSSATPPSSSPTMDAASGSGSGSLVRVVRVVSNAPARALSSRSYASSMPCATRRTASNARLACSGVAANASSGSHESGDARARRKKSTASSSISLSESANPRSVATRSRLACRSCRDNAATSASRRRAFVAGSSTTFTLGSISTRIMRRANSHVPAVSSTCADSPQTLATSAVRQFPPRLSLSTCVSLLLRYGTCSRRLSPSAMITCSRNERDLLMCCASLATDPELSVLSRRSEPARSTKLSFERSNR
mmetsp:Transcript_7226/g.29999  ORF Transcript_7226/g.29999 Transcript_7226/m.29999 type:complete len:271 (+) Transcript_7226:1072-1884(+)